jgi:hypothetical protein
MVLAVVVAVLGRPMVEPTTIDAVQRSVHADRSGIVYRASYDSSTGTFEVMLSAGATPDQLRAFWCETVGHPAILQGLPISVHQGDYDPVAPARDCGPLDDHVTRVVVIGGLWALAAVLSALIVITRANILARIARRTTASGRAWAGAWSSALLALPVGLVCGGLLLAVNAVAGNGLASLSLLAAAVLPATVAVAGVLGAVFGAWVARPSQVETIWPYIAMAVLGVVLGAYLAAGGMALLEAHASRDPVEASYVVAAGTIGLFVLGLPGLAATLLHAAFWRELLIEAVTPVSTAGHGQVAIQGGLPRTDRIATMGAAPWSPSSRGRRSLRWRAEA